MTKMTNRTQEQKEIKILKALVHAQDRMIRGYKIGTPTLPEWVFEAFNTARLFYKVHNISEI